ncbi:putative leader peptide [Streptacidiphilus melanogenes]
MSRRTVHSRAPQRGSGPSRPAPWSLATPAKADLSLMSDRSVSLFNTLVTVPDPFPSIVAMKRQADLTKRRAVDLCRVAACLCRMR